VTALALGASAYVSVFLYDRLPEQVPVHWNAAGQADGFVAKENSFLTFYVMPLAMVGVVGLTLLLPWLSPKHFEIDRFRGTYGYIMFLVTALLGYLHLAILLGSVWGTPLDVTRLVLGGILLFLALIGNVLGKVRRNFWVGVRTPWTLASDAVWEATHRLAAWLMVAGGLLGLVALLLGVPFWWCFVLVMVFVLIPVPYSLILYKRLQRQGKL
jgi:uncharacterized membrane protein